jgi:O-methyltransferase
MTVHSDPAALYLDLLKKCLTRYIFEKIYRPVSPRKATLPIRKLLAYLDVELVKRVDPTTRAEGLDWPADGETMIGLQRLDNLQYCVTEVLRRRVPGDIIETGVWRGGATILMRAVLKAYGDTERIVWVADSFQGLPKPDPARYPADAGDRHWTFTPLVVSLEEVKANFARFGLLDDQVRFLVGWFRDTLPSAPIDRLAVLRIDGDMYESTMDVLRHLYPKLSIGGYVIIDDYALRGCKAAVEDYRKQNGISETLERIDVTGVFWQKLVVRDTSAAVEADDAR